MRKTYLCNNCKKTGVKTSKAMLFESFFCPRCKKDTTLFLKPDEKIKDNLLIEEEINNNSTLNEVMTGRLFYLRDAIFFLIGFVAALLIMKN